MYIQQRDDIVATLDYLKENILNSNREVKSLVMNAMLLLDKLDEKSHFIRMKRIIMSWEVCQKNRSKSMCQQLLKWIDEEIQALKDTQCRYKAVFMPYKADMWFSLESIWKAATDDPYCDVVVMPIPFYDITDSENVEFHYEGDRFPNNVPITFYKDYLLENECPEMIFIHNPYDGENRVTRVPEYFYSTNIREYTKCLVYSPYFTFRTYCPGYSDFQYIAPGNIYSDYVLVQSEAVKEKYLSYGYASEKILVTGSPKIDKIVNLDKEKYEIPESWKEKIEGKKVFLVNTHMSYFAKAELNPTKVGNFALWHHNKILETFLNDDRCALIWRPHPLLEIMLKNNFPKSYENYLQIKQRVLESTNGIIDTTGDYTLAFSVSDALITTYSSLINEYMATGKPILVIERRQTEEAAKRAVLQGNVNYFRVGEGSITYQDFYEMILHDKDYMKEKRALEINRAFVNNDGTAGIKAYFAIREKIK